MNKKVVVLGGGTGLSTLLRGLKQFPLDISAIVAVSDDGRSTGRLREEFNIIAVGDLRQVLVSLSETEPLFEKLLNYRFRTTSDLNGHALGNILLTALYNITGNMAEGIESLGKVLNLKGKVIPFTEDNVTLMGKMDDGTIVSGEHNITEYDANIQDIFYQEEPHVTPEALRAIETADLIILSMGSLFTSIIPNLICKEMQDAIRESSAPILYVCNMMTQPGETDGFKVSDHIALLNRYLKNRHVDIVLVNTGNISEEVKEKYATMEQKDQVVYDALEVDKLGAKVVEDNFVLIEDNILRHDVVKLGFHIFSSMI